MNPYPKLGERTHFDVVRVLEVAVRERTSDIKDFDNLQNTYVSGRKVGKIPTGASDISPTDRVGDINYTASYLYIVINNAGTAEWRRVALSSW